jgi:hypothetical protein
MFTRNEQLRMVENDLRAALHKIGETHKVKLNVGSISYNNLYFTCSVKGIFLDAQGSTEEADKALWNANCAKFRLPKDMVGKTVTIGTDVYIIKGIAPKARKYPVLVEKSGKTYKLTGEAVVKAILTSNAPAILEALKKPEVVAYLKGEEKAVANG